MGKEKHQRAADLARLRSLITRLLLLEYLARHGQKRE